MTIRSFDEVKSELLSVNFVIPIGMFDTTDSKVTFAHIIEHLLFYGHSKYSQATLLEKIERVGAIINAETTDTYTVIYFRVLREYAVEIIELLYRAICDFNITEEDFQCEKRIIKQEQRVYDRNPLMVSLMKHYGCNTDMDITYEDILRIYDRYYNLKAWNLIVIGKDANKIVDRIKEYDIIKKGICNKVERPIRPDLIIEKNFEELVECNGTYYLLHYHRCYDLMNCLNSRLIKYIFTDGLDALLYNKFVVEKGYAYSIDFSYHIGNNDFFIISMEVDRDRSNIAMDDMRNIFENSNIMYEISNEAIERARRMTITSLWLKKENVSSLVNDSIAKTIGSSRYYNVDKAIDELKEYSCEKIREMISHMLFGNDNK